MPSTWIVTRSWVTYQRDTLGVMRRSTHSVVDRCENLAAAAAHYNRALEMRWVEPSWQEPAVTADAEVINLAEREQPVTRVPMPEMVREQLDRFAAELKARKCPG